MENEEIAKRAATAMTGVMKGYDEKDKELIRSAKDTALSAGKGVLKKAGKKAVDKGYVLQAPRNSSILGAYL